jgi:hypothetical protein
MNRQSIGNERVNAFTNSVCNIAATVDLEKSVKEQPTPFGAS